MLTGLYVPLITPFDHDGQVAFDALEALANEVLDAGADGIVALGTTGEPASLHETERSAVVDLIARVCRARSAPLIVGANSVEHLQALEKGVTAALSIVPAFVRPGEEGVVAWFRHLAAASPIPLVIYDIPYRTGQPISVDTVRRLAALPGVTGMKYAVGGITVDTVALLADPPEGFAILGGDDVVVSPMIALGAHGGILASAHLATAGFARLINGWREGSVDDARALGGRLSALSAALFAEPSPTVLKAVLHAQGRIPTPAVRLPLLPAGPASTAAAVKLVPQACG